MIDNTVRIFPVLQSCFPSIHFISIIAIISMITIVTCKFDGKPQARFSGNASGHGRDPSWKVIQSK